jgi:hypothetical protein
MFGGTLPAPTSHERKRPTLTVCDISGWRTRTVNFVAGPNIASANPHSPELGQRQHTGFIQCRGRDLHDVRGPFGIGERYAACSVSSRMAVNYRVGPFIRVPGLCPISPLPGRLFRQPAILPKNSSGAPRVVIERL